LRSVRVTIQKAFGIFPNHVAEVQVLQVDVSFVGIEGLTKGGFARLSGPGDRNNRKLGGPLKYFGAQLSWYHSSIILLVQNCNTTLKLYYFFYSSTYPTVSGETAGTCQIIPLSKKESDFTISVTSQVL